MSSVFESMAGIGGDETDDSSVIESEDVVDRCGSSQAQSEIIDDRRRLIREESGGDEGKKSRGLSRPGSTSSPTGSIASATLPHALIHGDVGQLWRHTSSRTSSSDSVVKPRDSSSYHIRRRLANFRSDSVFSDVTPLAGSSSASGIALGDPRKSSDPLDKGVSLSCKSSKESKWISLRKRLRIKDSRSSKSDTESRELNPSSGVSSSPPPSSQSSASNVTPIHPEKRSLFQRAKTLSILPIGKSRENSTEDAPGSRRRKAGGHTYNPHSHHHTIQEPKELFNVGGEMSMIPLELLIDINDLKIHSSSSSPITQPKE